MAPPLIGLSTYQEPVGWGARWRDVRCVFLPESYPELVRAAGGVPVLLPPGPPETAADLVTRLDGLVVTGGPDVDPARYGQRPHPATGPAAPVRDAWETALTEAALAQRVPLLGICRGLQLLNVVCGGTLHQHLPDAVGHSGHNPDPGSFPPHPVQVLPGTSLAAILGTGAPLDAPTHHHQGIDLLGRGLRPAARAEDGLIEAVEGEGDGFVLAVQWHPEEGGDPRVLRALVRAAGRADAPLS
jgi:putative glutamine amidotransferase